MPYAEPPASLELELSTAVRLSEPPNIIMLDPDLNLERCVRTPDRLSSTTPPLFVRSVLRDTIFPPFGASSFGAPGKLILPPWAFGPCWGAAPHRLQLLPSETIQAVCALVHAASPTLNTK
jgi:hypothetical protein